VRPPLGALRHPMQSFAGWVVKTTSAKRNSEGIVDLHLRRYMLFGPYAHIYTGGEHRGGAPGRSLCSLRADKGGAGRRRSGPSLAL
jgi:hypothetical protein